MHAARKPDIPFVSRAWWTRGRKIFWSILAGIVLLSTALTALAQGAKAMCTYIVDPHLRALEAKELQTMHRPIYDSLAELGAEIDSVNSKFGDLLNDTRLIRAVLEVSMPQNVIVRAKKKLAQDSAEQVWHVR